MFEYVSPKVLFKDKAPTKLSLALTFPLILHFLISRRIGSRRAQMFHIDLFKRSIVEALPW
jgi:hypothetical protein